MTKLKRKHLLIIVAFAASFAAVGVSVSQFTTGGISVSQILQSMLFDGPPDYVFDSFHRYWYDEEKVTTELIPCSSDSNSYTRIDIHRNYGIPRFAVITDCNGQILDTVNYSLGDFGRYRGMYNSPEYTDTSITVWWENTPFYVIITDVLTGEPVIQEVFKGQPSSMFNDTYLSDTIDFYDSLDASGNPVNLNISIRIPEGYKFPRTPKYDNNGTTVNYSHIPDGLYFLFIIDASRGEVAHVNTIYRGMVKREMIEGHIYTGIEEIKKFDMSNDNVDP